MHFDLTSHSLEETKQLGVALGKAMPAGTCVCLVGNLGAGKTVLTQGVCEGLGVSEPVTSPTFTLMNAYESGRVPVRHFDFYRLKSERELEDIGFEDYAYDDRAVTIIEWADQFLDALPEKRLDITLMYNDMVAALRRIHVHDTGEAWLAEAMAAWQR